jgi:hypothetical protein
MATNFSYPIDRHAVTRNRWRRMLQKLGLESEPDDFLPLRFANFVIGNATAGGPKARYLSTEGWEIERVQICSIESTTIKLDVRMGLISEIGIIDAETICATVYPELVAEQYADVEIKSWAKELPDECYLDFHVLSGAGYAELLLEGR